jgi:hypothetical protein
MKALNFVVWATLAVFVAFTATSAPAAEPVKKPEAAKTEPKKEVKKHKKVEGTPVPEKPTKK